MQSGIKIAIGGKGGVGKTTVCAVLAQLFAQSGYEVLAIDADPTANLASAFGISSEQNPKQLIDMKQLIAERTGTSKESVGAYFKLNPKVSDVPEKYWVQVGAEGSKKLKLLVLGAIKQAGAGCACPEGAFLKALLGHVMLQRQELVLVDLAAGVEFMGRASIAGIDGLVVVVEPGSRSIETANDIAKMGRQLGIKSVGAIANKIMEPGQIDVIKSQLKDVSLVGSIGYSPAVQEADIARKAVFTADAKVVETLKAAKDKLLDLITAKTEQNSV